MTGLVTGLWSVSWDSDGSDDGRCVAGRRSDAATDLLHRGDGRRADPTAAEGAPEGHVSTEL